MMSKDEEEESRDDTCFRSLLPKRVLKKQRKTLDCSFFLDFLSNLT